MTSQVIWLSAPQKFAEFSVEDYRFVRKTIKDIVLMTDMYHHSKLVQSLDSLVAAGPNESGIPLVNSFNANGRSTVLQMIVHAADISNTCRPPGPCGLWAKRVTDGEASCHCMLASHSLEFPGWPD